VHTLEGHGDRVSSVCMSPDGSQIISGSYDKTVKVWDASTGSCLHTLEGHGSDVTSVCMSPNGSQIISGSADETVKVWNESNT
jgi:WD40 repeat protein